MGRDGHESLLPGVVRETLHLYNYSHNIVARS